MHQADTSIDLVTHGANEVRDWVNRSPAARCQNMAGRNTPPRPLNAFMLYRKAYAIHLKSRVTNPDPKMLSKSAGRRWRQESVEVRNFYHNLAQLEKEQHAVAFPSYRFTPKKRVLCQHPRDPTIPACSETEMVTSAEQTCFVVDTQCHDSLKNHGTKEDEVLYLEVLQWLAEDIVYEE